MDPDRRTDQAQRDRLDIIHAEVLAERRRVTVLLSLIAALLFTLGGVSFYLRGQQSQLAHEAARQAQRASALASAVQQSRYENVFRGCLQDAERNVATIDKYDAALAKRLRTASPAERKRLGESRIFFVQLVDAFLPAQTAKQCADQARRTTRIPLPSG